MTYRHGDTLYHIHVRNPQGVNRGVAKIVLDGQTLDRLAIPLAQDGGSHKVHVSLGLS
jgi:cyclic beta-1,2-glucan synthetase